MQLASPLMALAIFRMLIFRMQIGRLRFVRFLIELGASKARKHSEPTSLRKCTETWGKPGLNRGDLRNRRGLPEGIAALFRGCDLLDFYRFRGLNLAVFGSKTGFNSMETDGFCTIWPFHEPILCQ